MVTDCHNHEGWVLPPEEFFDVRHKHNNNTDKTVERGLIDLSVLFQLDYSPSVTIYHTGRVSFYNVESKEYDIGLDDFFTDDIRKFSAALPLYKSLTDKWMAGYPVGYVHAVSTGNSGNKEKSTLRARRKIDTTITGNNESEAKSIDSKIDVSHGLALNDPSLKFLDSEELEAPNGLETLGRWFVLPNSNEIYGINPFNDEHGSIKNLTEEEHKRIFDLATEKAKVDSDAQDSLIGARIDIMNKCLEQLKSVRTVYTTMYDQKRKNLANQYNDVKAVMGNRKNYTIESCIAYPDIASMMDDSNDGLDLDIGIPPVVGFSDGTPMVMHSVTAGPSGPLGLSTTAVNASSNTAIAAPAGLTGLDLLVSVLPANS
jgi:hypothetical protein